MTTPSSPQPQAEARPARDRKLGFATRSAITGWLLVLPVLLLLAGFLLVPLVQSIQYSFYDASLIGEKGRYVGLANYTKVFESGKIAGISGITLLWTFGSLVGQLALGLAAALTINQLQRGGRLFRSLLLLPYAVPAISLALIWRWMFSDGTGILTFWLQSLSLFPANTSPLGSADAAIWLVVMANVWHGFPFAMLIYWAALQQIDSSLYEAASLDGANAWQKFRYITLPSLSTATIALVVLRGIWTATSFDLPWLLTGGGPAGSTYVWPIWIYEEAMGFFRPGRAAVLALMLGAAIGAVIFIFRRAIRASLTTH
ncbi:sugar ABC transporter permease [Ferrovibrio sp.]|uniref:carbohydrate ABC transporter permease n=1 Tax=Ferrovibrio sp. TaxID=1917215 RepID=UPI0025BC069C|nr:sugar ABC transporter permease [Ferrovibrio sp.]MBX3456412.1 sugar ABC transporter permease [Ferrovibrio sp.]